jgi:putative ABC transport system permease protein
MIRPLRRAWNRVLGSFSGRARERDLAEELEAHIQLLTEDEIRRGVAPDEAQRRARLQFGNVASTKESYRHQRGLPILDAIAQDLRYAVRAIRRSPGFATVAVLLIAIGIGANATLFSIINAVVLRPLPYPESDRLVWVGETRADLPFSSANPGAVSYQNYVDWRMQQTVFESVGAYQPAGGSPGAFLIGGEPVRLEIQRMSADAFAALKVEPIIGRVFNHDEDRRGGTPSVVLSYRTWQEHFGGQPVAGRPVIMNSVVHTILGVMPPGFSFPYKDIDAWLPLGSIPVPRRAAHDLASVARLKAGVTLQQARAEMATIAARLEQAYPDANKDWKGRVEPMIDVVVGDADRPLWILFGAVSLVLLIACFNLANLLLARASARQQEMLVRAALGASRLRIARQLVAESLVLSVIGTGLALLLATMGITVFLALAGNAIPRSAEIRLDGTVLGFAALLAGLTGLVFGLAPACMSSAPALQESLQAASTRGSTGKQGRIRQGLVVAEVALTLVLLIAAGLLLRSFERLQSVNPGFSAEHVVSFDLTIPGVKYNTRELQSGFFENLIDRLRTLPGVEAVGTTSRLPLKQKSGQVFSYSVEGQLHPAGRELHSMELLITSPGYFNVMGIPLQRGRLFTEQDGPGVDGVVVVDDEFAKRHWPNADPIGRRIRLEAGRDLSLPLTVIGVVARVKLASLSEEGGFGQAYLPVKQLGGINASVVLKSHLTAATLAGAIREQVRAVDSAQPIHHLSTSLEIRDSSLTADKLNLSVLGAFALVALTLSVVGLYGVIAYSVARRQREIGVRAALGAQRSDILRLVLGQGMRLTALGIVLGVVGAFWSTRWLSSLLFGVTPGDPLTFAAVSLLLLSVAFIACWMPAHRATRIDPGRALRAQ